MKYEDKQEIPGMFLLPASMVVALINTTLVMPFDCVKTHMEKRDPSSTYLGSFRVIYNQGGIISFFTGFRLRFMLYFINAFFVVSLLEKFESISAYLHRKKE